MNQEGLQSYNEEQIRIQKQLLELAKEEFELKKQKEEWEYEQKIKDLDLEQKQVQFYSEQKHRRFSLENQEKEKSAKLKGYIAAGVLKGTTSVVMICAGVYFTSVGNNIGPFIMGTGATGVGIETTKILKSGGKEDDGKEAQAREKIKNED
jgi:hypothetical protein